MVAKYEKEFRTFRVSRIIEAKLGDSFERPERFDLERYWKDSTLNFYLKFRLIRCILKFAFQNLIFKNILSARILEYSKIDKDWVEVKADLETKEWALHHILGLGDSVVLWEPEELRKVVLSSVGKIIDFYFKTL
ncbi:WYL domain protein [Leptospira interrogans serovar Bataviae str. HAI135]|nr:WYL domain protein [Leptospira interrogans serovar Bataviae str. HAI135]